MPRMEVKVVLTFLLHRDLSWECGEGDRAAGRRSGESAGA